MNMYEIIVILIVVIGSFSIFILNLLKVIKLFDKNNIVVKAICNTYMGAYGHVYSIVEYKIKDKNYSKEYTPFFDRINYIYLIVNRVFGNIITTRLNRNVLFFLLVINSIFTFLIVFACIVYLNS